MAIGLYFFKKVYVPIFELFQKLCELFPCIVKLPAAPLEKKCCQSDATTSTKRYYFFLLSCSDLLCVTGV